MEPYTYHIGQLFLFGDQHGLHPNSPLLEECGGDMVLDYLTDWVVRLYNNAVITAQDLRHYLNLLDGTYPEIRQCLYSWLQAER